MAEITGMFSPCGYRRRRIGIMNEITEPNTDHGEVTKLPIEKPRFGRLMIITLGGLASLLVVAAPRNNSVDAHIAAWIAGAFCVAITDFMIWSVFLQQWRKTRRLRVFCAVLVGSFVGSFSSLTENIAFNKAFGIDTPEFVKEVDVVGHYCRGPQCGIGDLVLFLQFNVDRTGLQKILSEREFDRDDQKEQLWSNHEHPWSSDGRLIQRREMAWRSLFSGLLVFSNAKWNVVALPTSVEFYQWGQHGGHYTRLLWDMDTGRTYVVYTVG